MDPEKESCGISFTSKEKNEKIDQVPLCFVVGLIIDKLAENRLKKFMVCKNYGI